MLTVYDKVHLLHYFYILLFYISQPVKGVSQNINYTTTALLPVLTSLFDHIAQHQFGDDVIRKDYFENEIRYKYGFVVLICC